MLMLNHVNAVRKLQVARNWEHMDIIVETLLFSAQQNKTCTNVGEIHNINCGYLGAFLYLSYYETRKNWKLEAHMKWVSPTV